MTEEYEMTWLSLVENYVFVAVSQGCVQIAIYLARFACGLTALPASKAVLLQPASVVVAWEVLGKPGYRCSSSWGLLCSGFSLSSAYSTVSWSRQWSASGSGSDIITFLPNEC